MTSVSLRRKHKLTGKKVWPYLFLIPFFVIYLSFNFYPLIYSFVISLTQWDGFTEPVFVGLSNFVNIFTDDPYFLKSIGNTLLFMLFNAPFVLIGGLILQADSRPQCFSAGYISALSHHTGSHRRIIHAAI